jgi:oligopeptide/dipeptide ABC transporter ATP-binding protein
MNVQPAIPSLLVAEHVTRHFVTQRGLFWNSRRVVRAVDDVSLEINAGETYGLVGESGSGKSTLGRLVARIVSPNAGRLRLNGLDLAGSGGRHDYARRVQMVFQDTLGALNPRLNIGHQLTEVLDIHTIGDAASRQERATDILRAVGLGEDAARRYPHEISGGQRQRVVIARALLLEPSLIVCDEPVSALDVSVQAQVIEIFRDLQQRQNVAYLFISHDLRVVRQVSHRIGVMYLGEIVEQAPRSALFAAPRHPYTRALIDAVPSSQPGRRRAPLALRGEPPSPMAPPSGCRFHTRCAFALPVCRNEAPPQRLVGPEHLVACHRADTLDLAA